jgi:hypothetical protein
MEFYRAKKGLVGGLILLLGICLVMAGCESDSVTPNDQLPALTEKGAVQQAALVAVGIAKAGPELLKFSGKKDLGIYTYTFPPGGDISGVIMLEYFTGGPGGTHTDWETADYGLLYTTEGEQVTVVLDLEGVEPEFSLTFDLEGPINQAEDSAEVFGSGNFTSGESSNDFTIDEEDPILLEELSSYPDGGTFMYVVDSISVAVVYDGDVTADVFISEAPEPGYSINLDTGIVTVIE